MLETGQTIDWNTYIQSFKKYTPVNCVWSGPNVNHIWEELQSVKSINGDDDAFMMNEEELTRFIEHVIDEKEGFVKNSILKLQRITEGFDFENDRLIFFFS